MISLLLLTLLILIIVSNKEDNRLMLWGQLAFSYFLSTSLIGTAVMWLGFIPNFFNTVPIIVLVLIVWVVYVLNVIFRKDLTTLKYQLKNIYSELSGSFIQLSTGVILLFLFILLSSIGPINHPDAADYHVGYVFQLLRNKQWYNDGGLHFGLLGLGDFANLSFLQENSSWLIRTAQPLILLPALGVLHELKRSKWEQLLLLSLPVMIQWSTIGKPLLVTDAALIISFIISVNQNNSRFLFQFLFVGILSLAFKLSSLLIFFPLFVGLMVYILYIPKYRIGIQIKNIQIVATLIISTIAISVLYFRFIHLGNPLYPFLSNWFSPDRIDYIAFAEYLRSYRREGSFWGLSLFVPTSFRYIASVLGPIIPVVIFLYLKEAFATRQQKILAFTFLGVLVSLLAFSQARGDYYFAPTMMLLAVLGSDKIIGVHKNFRYVIFLQVIYTVLLFSVNLFQTIDVLRNPNQNLGKYAYGYNESKAAEGLPEPTLYRGFRQTRLYFTGDYIDNDRFEFFHEDEKNVKKALELFGIRSIVATSQEINNLRIDTLAGWQIEDPIITYRVSRNPFNKEEIEIFRCYLE